MKLENRKLLRSKNKIKIIKGDTKWDKKYLCRGKRLEDLEPCERRKLKKDDHCYIHSKIRVLLLSRRTYIFNNIDDDGTENHQFRHFIAEHFNQIFPDEYVATECNLSKLIWLNKNDVVRPPNDKCCALNLIDGTTCEKTIRGRKVLSGPFTIEDNACDTLSL